MPPASPVANRPAVAALLLLTVATGIIDAISVLSLGGVFVANMTGNVVFLGFWFATGSSIDLSAAVAAVLGFLAGAVISGRLVRRVGHRTRRWLTLTLATEVVVLLALSGLAGCGLLDYADATRLALIAGLGVTFGMQNAMARQFGMQELSTTVLTSTVVALGFDSRLAGGTGAGKKLRLAVLSAMCGGAVIGASLSRVVVAPVIALAAVPIAAAAVIFTLRPPRRAERG